MTRPRRKNILLHRVARAGLGAKGIVYLLFGGLVCYGAVTGRRRVTDEQGAMTSLLSQPLGKILLAVLAAGLLAYSLWRLYELIVNPDGVEGFWNVRAKPLLSSIVYGSLAVEALRMILGLSPGGEGEESTREQAALVMSLPMGHWVLVGFGAILMVSTALELWQSVTGKRQPDARPPAASLRRWNERLNRFGETARSVMGLVAGAFLILSGFHRSAGEVRGSRGALEKIAEQPFGRWLLLLTALGLMFYGIVKLMEARYRRLNAR